MSTKLNEEEAADYVAMLRTEQARRECVRYWRDRHGRAYASKVVALTRKRYPRKDLGIDGLV